MKMTVTDMRTEMTRGFLLFDLDTLGCPPGPFKSEGLGFSRGYILFCCSSHLIRRTKTMKGSTRQKRSQISTSFKYDVFGKASATLWYSVYMTSIEVSDNMMVASKRCSGMKSESKTTIARQRVGT